MQPRANYPDLAGRSVLITGGGSGIGAALTESFARHGSKVAFVDIAREASEALVAGLPGNPLFIPCDIRDIAALRAAGVRVSLFVEPDEAVMEAAHRLGAPVVELHTGTYCEAVAAGDAGRVATELARIARAATHGAGLGLEIHAGHGLALDSVAPVAALPEIAELNIGHALIGEAIFCGLAQAVRDMRAAMDRGRAGAPA